MRLNAIARENRVLKYKDKVKAKLAHRVIDVDKPEFADLLNFKGEKMSSLNGAILLDKHIENGKLMGVHSIEADDLASQLPELKKERQNGTDIGGWGKHLDMFEAEGANILEAVDDPTSDEFELPAVEELETLDIAGMSDFEAKQKLLELQQRLALEG